MKKLLLKISVLIIKHYSRELTIDILYDNSAGPFGKRLRNIRKSFGFTQSQLAHLLGLKSKVSVSDWEKGKHLPDLNQVAIIAVLLNVTTDYLILGRTNKTISN